MHRIAYCISIAVSILVNTLWSLTPKYLSDKSLVVVVTSYNNARWYRWNLESVFCQTYENYHVIYIDDNSSDNTAGLVEEYIAQTNQQERITLIKNKNRVGAMANIYKAVHMCDPSSIIVILDGDDRFSHDKVLAQVNDYYSDGKTWLTYGQYKEYPSGTVGFCESLPDWVLERNMFREYDYVQSHLRTFYAGLFHHIKKEDLMINGTFVAMSYDVAMMLPMSEMARKGHVKFIPDILVDYNAVNPLSDHRVSQTLQQATNHLIRTRKRYEAIDTFLKAPIIPQQYKIGVIVVATGSYANFIPSFIESAQKHFCKEHDVTYFVFTDKQLEYMPHVKTFYCPLLNSPGNPLMRIMAPFNYRDYLIDMDYLFVCDAHTIFLENIGDEILSERVAVQHPYYYNNNEIVVTQKELPNSVTEQSAFSSNLYGGTMLNVMRQLLVMKDQICNDSGNQIIATVKSHLNRFFTLNPPTLVLDPSYCFPQNSNQARRWKINDLKPNIMTLEVDHDALQMKKITA